jgi:hypothetical protein
VAVDANKYLGDILGYLTVKKIRNFILFAEGDLIHLCIPEYAFVEEI